MEQTCITIHNLSAECNVLFASDSIADILGWNPDEVRGQSCFDFFHPDEVPFARSVHTRGVLLDKAAVLHYARLRSRDGRWISCECCFTVVHDVLVASTSIYRQGIKSERRAIEAPQIRRIFSCSPRDPRYHMLIHLSPKFKMPPMEREPRAALILNRFTRNLNIMFATTAVSQILGLQPDEIIDKSFYRCIQENCLRSAIDCLESAKSNDSIAYLRFWYRDPTDDERDCIGVGEEEGSCESGETSDSEGGGAELGESEDEDMDDLDVKHEDEDIHIKQEPVDEDGDVHIKQEPDSDDEMDHTPTRPPRRCRRRTGSSRSHRRREPSIDSQPPLELEAVVSCTSDGLVVVLRKARPPIPPAHPPLLPLDYLYENGVFAAPWAQRAKSPQPQPPQRHPSPPQPQTFRPSILPQFSRRHSSDSVAQNSGKKPSPSGQPEEQLMSSIRDVAVFAWAVVGINGELAAYSHGVPQGEAQPPDGLPIWDPHAANANNPYQGPENQAALRWAREEQQPRRPSAQEAALSEYLRYPPPSEERLPWPAPNAQVPPVSSPDERSDLRYLWR